MGQAEVRALDGVSLEIGQGDYVAIMALLGDLHRSGNTIVLVTHEEELAARAARIVRLRDGKIVQDRRNGTAVD